MLTRLTLGGFAAMLMTLTGCGESSPSGTATPSAEGAAYLAASEPGGAKGVGEARKVTSDGEEVTLVGRIGGSSEPFVDGLAAFTIVDPLVPYCTDDEGCPTPWDYCCQTDKLAENSATVKIVDDADKPVALSARELLGVKELSVVVVHGKARRDEAGNLTVLANKVFVRPEGATAPPSKEAPDHDHDGHDHEGHDHEEHDHDTVKT